jgi:hypothetical protein
MRSKGLTLTERRAFYDYLRDLGFKCRSDDQIDAVQVDVVRILVKSFSRESMSTQGRHENGLQWRLRISKGGRYGENKGQKSNLLSVEEFQARNDSEHGKQKRSLC